MALVLAFSAQSLLACRFAISPLHETMAAVRLLAGPARGPFHQPWLHAIGPALDRLELTPLMLLTPRTTYGPDFLSPPPVGPDTTFAQEIDVVRSTSPDEVRRQINRCLDERFGGRVRPAVTLLGPDAAATRDLCADLLTRCWTELVEPWWPRIRMLLQEDIAYRSRRLADGGLAAVLADLHPRVRWSGRDLHVDLRLDARRSVGPDGIVLMPGVFGVPGVGVAYDPPWPPTIDYAARGVGRLWTTEEPTPGGLANLLGLRRATVLTALAEPSTTSGLAARCDLPASSVSEHLTVLRGAGLVTATRVGRHVRHEQTALGSALVDAEAGSAGAGGPAA